MEVDVRIRLCPVLSDNVIYKAMVLQTVPCPERLHFYKGTFDSIVDTEDNCAPKWIHKWDHLHSTAHTASTEK